MTVEKLVEYLIDYSEANERVKLFVDRMLLRFYSEPATIAFLEDVNIVENGGTDFVVELLFRPFPKDKIPVIGHLIGEKNIEALEFQNEGGHYFGFRIRLDAEALGLNQGPNSSLPNLD